MLAGIGLAIDHFTLQIGIVFRLFLSAVALLTIIALLTTIRLLSGVRIFSASGIVGI